MIAFKTLSSCPIEQRPEGMPLEWPWMEQSIPNATMIESLENDGFLVLSESEYEDYKAGLDPNILLRRTVEEKLLFGTNLSRECVVRLGTLDASIEDVSSMLSALSPIKSLLETGALTTAKYVLSMTISGFSGASADILQYAIDSITEFGY